MTWASIAADFQGHLWSYLGMPLVAGFVGYVTKTLALEMMFRPLEFVGIKPPWLGWQGVVPRKAHKMASTAADLLMNRLIRVEDLIGRLDPQRMVLEMEQPLKAASAELAQEIGERYIPGFWNLLPQFARQAMIRRMQAEVPAIAQKLWEDVRRDPQRYFDARHLLVANLVKDKALLNEIFRSMGHAEFRFFKNAGFWFGFVLGLIQLACWMAWHQPWMIPAFGAFVGLVSDWTALQMLFRPLHPRHVFGYRWQGRFLLRQNEVARDYASLIAKELLTPANMVEELMRGPLADRLVDLIHKHVKQSSDESLGMVRPLVVYAMGSDRYDEIRRHVATRVIELLPETSKHVEKYTMDALDINTTIVAKMELLTPEEFEAMLRPVFKEDESTLILCGAVLGFLIGELQVHVML